MMNGVSDETWYQVKRFEALTSLKELNEMVLADIAIAKALNNGTL